MGKRKKKNRNLSQHHSPVQQTPSPVSHSQPAITKPVEVRDTAVYQAHQAEYKAISSDLIRVAVINGVFLVAVIALYYIDKSNPFLKDLFARIL